MSEGLNVADVYTTVKFNPDQASLGDALKEVKGKFEDISKKVNGIASGVKGLFAIQAFSAVAGIASTIASNIGAAAANAQHLSKMAQRTGKSVEELQKRQGLSVILSKQEVDALANISRMFSDMSNVANKQMARLATVIEPIITNVREFLNSKEFQGIIDEFKKDIEEIWKIASPIMSAVMGIFKNVFGFVKQIWQALQPVFASVASIVKMALNFFNIAIKSALPNLIKYINAIIKPIRIAFSLLEEIFAIFDDTVDGYFESQPGFKEAAAKMQAGAKWLMDFFEKIRGIVADIFTWIIDKTIEGWRLIFENIPNLWKWLVKLSDKLTELVGKFSVFNKIGGLINGEIFPQSNTRKPNISSDSDSLDEMINKPERFFPSSTTNNNRNSTTTNTNNITVNINGGASSPAQIKKAAEEGVLNANRLSNAMR